MITFDPERGTFLIEVLKWCLLVPKQREEKTLSVTEIFQLPLEMS